MSEKNPGRIHAFKDPKIGQKGPSPHDKRTGPVFTSTSQKKRYITIDGIVSDTSYSEDQWPEFALKELADNSYEFFVVNYPDAAREVRRISTQIKIDTKKYPGVKILRIAVRNSNVGNRAAFPDLHGIFDYDRWGSTKRGQHRMTAGGLGDFLKRVLGMGYASWTSNNDNPNDSFEDKQWPEPVILRFDGKEYKVFLIVNGDRILTQIHGPVTIDNIGTDTEVEVSLPLVNCWLGDDNNAMLLNKLEGYHKTFKLIKRNVDFAFSTGVA
jgi:hypothetical protein